MIFLNTLWVFRLKNARLAKKLFGLLTSGVFNFLYGAVSTNNHVNMNVLFSLPVKDVDLPSLEDLVDRAGEKGTELREILVRYGGKLEKEKVILDPVELMGGRKNRSCALKGLDRERMGLGQSHEGKEAESYAKRRLFDLQQSPC